MTVLLLDFDGLLCDTETAAMRAWRDCYRRLGATFRPALEARMVGDSAGARIALADLAAQIGRPLTGEEWIWQRRRKVALADQAPAMPGALSLLTAAAGRGIAVGVVSSSSSEWVRGHLRRLGFLDRIGFLVTGDDTARHKPHPDLYLLALARAGVIARAAVAVEDSPTGVRAAKAAGLRCVAVPGASGAGRDFTLADAVLPSLHHLDLDAYFHEKSLNR